MRYSKKFYIIMLFCSVLFASFQAHKFWEGTHKKEQEVAVLYAGRIQSVVQEIVDDGRVLQEMFNLFPGALSKKNFDDISRIIFNSQYYVFISYQPEGVVQYIYPEEKYEWTVGMDVLTEKHSREDAIYAKNSGRTIFAGPYKTGNIEAIVSRRPVFHYTADGKREFWGFISVGFDVEKILKDVIGIGTLANFDFEYGVYTIFKGQAVEVGSSEGFDKDKGYKRIFTLGDQTWSLYLYDKSKIEQLNIVFLSFLVSYTVLATIMYYIIKKFELKHLKSKKLSYMDVLTSAYNRKMVEEYIEQRQLTPKDAFTLFYMDLNDFKPVNDVHGHEVGDKLLVAFVERMRHNFKADSVVARMGGDEFVLILQQEFSETALKSIIARIDALSKKQFYIDTLNINISSSIGFGQFPQEGNSMAEILAKADERMYAWKKRVKDERAAKGESVR